MMPGIKKLTVCFILNLTFSPLFSQTSSESVLTALKIDHVNIAVQDLKTARRQFEKLGFVIKPGRLHKNGILNAFTKFKDGNLLELITSSKEADELSSWYLQFIQKNPAGAGAFVALKVESKSKLEILKRHFTKRGFAWIIRIRATLKHFLLTQTIYFTHCSSYPIRAKLRINPFILITPTPLKVCTRSG